MAEPVVDFMATNENPVFVQSVENCDRVSVWKDWPIVNVERTFARRVVVVA